MANRYYTVMIVPEKTSHVRKIVVPAWIFRGLAVGLAFLALLTIVMVLDYAYVMNQVSENRTLKLENRRLKQQVQVFQNKLTSIESTMDRIKTFATRLKVITNIEDRGGLLQSLNEGKHPLPDAATNIGTSGATGVPAAGGATISAVKPSTPASVAQIQATPEETPEEVHLRQEFDELSGHFVSLDRDTLYVEQVLHNQYELLADQKAFLAALPTRKPAVGYFTSGFGVRLSPFGGRSKMHEGLDIANRPGTPIKAPADGTVTYAGGKSGYGQTLIIEHGYGIETWYGHTRKILVKSGDKVRRGDTIALLGNTGRSTGPHVHYEVRVHGIPVDPLSYILEN